MIQERELSKSVQQFGDDPHLLKRAIAENVDRLISNISVDNKTLLTSKTINSITRDNIDSHRFANGAASAVTKAYHHPAKEHSSASNQKKQRQQ